MRLGLALDLRNPPAARQSFPDLYAQTIDLIAHAEASGIDVVKVGEHHCFADGYMPQPLTFLAALAARTGSIRLATGILIAPLHAAVEIAEQAAVVDCLSAGRLELAIGAGYHAEEFALYGVDIGRRFALLEERIVALAQLLHEGPITPGPVQASIPLWAGVKGPRGMHMAGRLGMALLNLASEHWPAYAAGLAEGGWRPDRARLGGSLRAILATDPDSTRARLAERIEHDRASYASVATPGQSIDNTVLVLTPIEAAERLSTMAAGRTIDTVYLQATVSGSVDDAAYENVGLITGELRKLLPPG
jgi:alkanesulfonate monooxygenase SsuD/methylene tetrahydromethanopterin reductase-like flavin-dependent oxidoreductase (luciferase family)